MGPILPLVPGPTNRKRGQRRALTFLGAMLLSTALGAPELGVLTGLMLLLDDLIDARP